MSGFSGNLGNLPGGQIAFPATQNPSADPNTLDDYEEGTWTPVLTFATPGNLSVAYTLQAARYVKIGKLVCLSFVVSTSAFTWTTASGAVEITGVPFASSNDSASDRWYAPAVYAGITKANYAQVTGFLAPNSSTIFFLMSGQGQAIAQLVAADFPTGGSVLLGAEIYYEAAT